MIHDDIEKLLSRTQPDTALLLELAQATTPVQVSLSADMAASLGTPQRRLTPFAATIVEAISSKLEVAEDKIKAGKVKVSKEIANWLGDNSWSIVEKELYARVVRDGVAHVLTMWTDAGPTYIVRQQFNGECGAHMVCDRGEPIFAFNAWVEDDGQYCDLYYPNHIEKYIKKSGDDSKWEPRQDVLDEAWPLPWTDRDGNPLGIAITTFMIDGSQIEDSLQIARDMNENLLDILATSRTQGWPQRWVAGLKNGDALVNQFNNPLISPVNNRPIRTTLRPSPGSIVQLNDGAALNQLASSVPDRITMDMLLELLSLVSTVPTHFFTGDWPSGVALIQAESRLNHKVEGIQARLTTAIVALLQLTIRLSNYFARTSYDPQQSIDIPWESPEVETEDLRQEREVARKDKVVDLFNAKLMSRETAIRELHPEWDDSDVLEELARLDAEVAAAAVAPVAPVVAA